MNYLAKHLRGTLWITILLAVIANSAVAQQGQPRRFTMTPRLSGPEDPERGKLRGTIQLGETVVIEIPGGFDSILEPGVVPELSERRHSRRGGPFKIEGIKPGDWVAIHILAVEPGLYGYYNNGGPFRGSLRRVAPVKDGLLHFPPDFVVPVRPMVGIVQLEPRLSHPGGAWNHGGNLDLNSIRAGSTVYIRAQKYGGMLTIGDTHAYQGDGELTGTGVEIDTTVTIKVERGPDFPNGGVVVETAEKWYATGVAADWETALKVAWTEAVALVEHLYGATAEHANLIVGTIGDTLPGYAAGKLNSRGFSKDGAYVTLQIGIPKSLRRTGQPFKP